MLKDEYITLNNGHKMPRLGLGTWKNPDNIENSIKAAINIGFRSIDTAPDYETEEGIGKALQDLFKEGKIKREDVFITTKLCNMNHDNVAEALTTSLKKLQLDYLDLYLIHWPLCVDDDHKPLPQVPLYKTWRALEAEVKAGRIKSIGLANYNVQLILDLLSYAEIKPAINQIELHPYLVQDEIVDWCKKQNIEITAYSPLGGDMPKADFEVNDVLEEPIIKELAEKYKKTPGQIVINWHLRRGYVTIPKTGKEERVKENFESTSFELSEEDCKKISKLNRGMRSCDPIKIFKTPCFH